MDRLDYDYRQRLKRIDGYVEIRRHNNTIIELKAGLYATLFFKNFDPLVDNNERTREALIECWNDYWQVVGQEHQKWIYKFGSSITAHRLPTTKVPLIERYLRDPKNFGDYFYYVHGGEHEDDANGYLFNLYGSGTDGRQTYKLGYFRLQAPLSFVTNGRLAEFVELIKRCAKRLDVDQAHGGLGFLRTYNEENTTRYAESQLSKVFSGVDIDVPYVQLTNAYSEFRGGHVGIDSPHWLNFLNNYWAEKLGGIEAIRAQLPPDQFVVEAYEGGLFIQAGPYPEPGHREDGLPPSYVLLNRVLKPIRSPEMVYAMGNTPGQLARYQGAHEYFTRFDEPAAEESTLPPAPVFAMTGEPCPRSGLWSPRAEVPLPDGFVKQGSRMPAAEWNDQYGQFHSRDIKWQLVKASD